MITDTENSMMKNLDRVSMRIKHFNQKVKGLVYGVNLNSGYTSKRDFILWENAETGALKQDTSTVSLLHGTFLAIDPFISYNNYRTILNMTLE